MKRASAALLMLCGWSNAVSAAPPLDPAALSRDVDRRGPASVIQALNKDGRWDAALARMDAGSTPWLALAEKLAPGSDAGTAEDLGISLAKALPRNPAGVLGVATPDDGPISVKRVCSLPFIEQSEAEMSAYRSTALKAVARVTAQRLTDKRQLCLAALRP